jgi:nitroreductase
MPDALDRIFQRRAVKIFEPVEISDEFREQILNAARHAPSSFNTQPYKFYWVQSPANRSVVARLCLGQKPAVTASALVVAVADIGSFSATSLRQLEWMRSNGFSQERIRTYARDARIGRILFLPGPFGTFAAIKRALFQLLHLRMVIGIPPLSRQDLFKWATKNTSLACQNLMIATEALGMNTCPMEGIDRGRLSQYLGLSNRYHEIVMVIAIGKKSPACHVPPQWRRPLDTTVTVL